MNRHRTAMTTAKTKTYELLLNKSGNAVEQHYSASEIEIMEPETYSGLVNSALPSSSHTINNEIRSSNRRYHHKKRHNDDMPSSSSIPVVSTDSQDERIEVKILPQDDNWGETTTITCNGGNEDTLTNNNDTTLQLNDNHHHNEHLQILSNNFHQRTLSVTISQFIIYLLCLIAFISPIFFLILPYILLTSDTILSIDDYSPILTIIFKLIFLFFGTFLLLYRRRNQTYLPCIHIQKTCLIMILLIIIIVYWFYYIYKILKSRIDKYERILSMTSTYEDLLLFILILSVFILEIKWLYPKWIVKVVRSPDGQIRQYTIGSMSIQEASVYLLEQYYKDFPVFNPWLENAHQTQAKRHRAFSTKSIGSQSNSSTIATGTNGINTTRSMRGLNDRFYDELDYERRVRKRRTKLIMSCEDAFTHVRKCHDEKYGSHIPMDAREAAQAVFSSMSRSLQKYLRLTRQQPYFTRESIITHLATCLSHDLSPRTFLERYIQTESQPLATLLFPVLASITKNQEQSWILVCDTQTLTNDEEKCQRISINQSIYSNLIFVLKQQHAEHIALICTFHQIPRIKLIEKFFDLKQNKFVLKLNSETSV
ncbi:unnamed protein product [Rotaria sordida]|uniref:Vang-like protein n=1 Tax=Rotaria sordida TaxID=392033 RepID=A0A814PS70_9BILA|nr:unnamed protein product [Rotaria sordida]